MAERNYARISWCFTWFDIKSPPVYDDTKMQYLIYQEEKCPKTGSIHLQGFVQFRNRKKMNGAKAALNSKTVHLEITKGTPQQAADYCRKGETRIEGGLFAEYGKLVKQGQRTDLLHVKKLIDEGKSYAELCQDEEVVCTVARSASFVKELISQREEKEGLDQLRFKYSQVELKEWQDELTGDCQDAPDDRTVTWVCDSQGGQGKSWWANYMMVEQDGLVLMPGRLPDLAYQWKQSSSKVKTVIFDVTRSNQEDGYLLSCLSLAEALKNGRVSSTKYQSCMVYRPAPHVVFLANFWPKTECLSLDRWRLLELKDDKLHPIKVEDLPLAWKP